MRPDRTRIRAQLLVLLTVCLAAPVTRAYQGDLLLTGEVVSLKAQEIFVPLTTNWQAAISKMVEEGSEVDTGDVIIEFDGAAANAQLEGQREARLAELAVTDRDLARLEKELEQARYALKRAEVDLELKKLKAEVPEGLIGAIEYEENQLAWETAEKDLVEARARFADTAQSLAERRRQALLDERKTEIVESWWSEMLESLAIRAEQPGFVLYRSHPWTREKFQEGDNVMTSFHVATVADASDLAIRVWINSVDRPRIGAGARVRIVFDALPGQQIEGELHSLSDSGAKRREWGDAVYYEGTVSFDFRQVPDLLPGMSALVEVMP